MKNYNTILGMALEVEAGKIFSVIFDRVLSGMEKLDGYYFSKREDLNDVHKYVERLNDVNGGIHYVMENGYIIGIKFMDNVDYEKMGVYYKTGVDNGWFDSEFIEFYIKKLNKDNNDVSNILDNEIMVYNNKEKRLIVNNSNASIKFFQNYIEKDIITKMIIDQMIKEGYIELLNERIEYMGKNVGMYFMGNRWKASIERMENGDLVAKYISAYYEVAVIITIDNVVYYKRNILMEGIVKVYDGKEVIDYRGFFDMIFILNQVNKMNKVNIGNKE